MTWGGHGEDMVLTCGGEDLGRRGLGAARAWGSEAADLGRRGLGADLWRLGLGVVRAWGGEALVLTWGCDSQARPWGEAGLGRRGLWVARA